MGGDVEDSGLGVVERRADVDATPAGVLRLLPGSGAVRPHAAAIASKDPPIVRVAEVNTVVERGEHPVAQQAGDRQRRHPQHRARRTPVVLVIQPDHVGAIGNRRA